MSISSNKCLLGAHADEYPNDRLISTYRFYCLNLRSPQEFKKQNKNLNQRLIVSQPNNQKVNIVSCTKITNCLQRLRVSQPSNQKVRATKFTHDHNQNGTTQEKATSPQRDESTQVCQILGTDPPAKLYKNISRKHLVKENKVFIQENVVNALSLCFSRSKIVQPKIYLMTW